MKTKGAWHAEGDLTTPQALHDTLSYPLSHLHSPDLLREEEEIFQHYVNWQLFNNHRFSTHPNEGKEFYDVPDVMYYDLMGLIPHLDEGGGFDDHFDIIGPYFAKSQIAYREMEIIAVAKDFGYVTMEQHYWGTSTDGNDFDFTFRITSNLRKRGGKWKWVHEHVSFPVNIATRTADFTCSQYATEHLKINDEDNVKVIEN
ncbi:uncharacterized protein PAC_03424 [Phialocephala subalpina]|uniref:SnoaL-like domain-containing protein n=1 Tax=Phialocephala subalpina TaxID=576137 RepID=A0A1L7WLB5_9HELO|nr:uncharacterized protein PAC_03424 [Phialocephala subalpina]